jgi:hypothetical protein
VSDEVAGVRSTPLRYTGLGVVLVPVGGSVPPSQKSAAGPPPLGVVTPAWKPHVQPDNGPVDAKAYVFCTLDRLRQALKRRDVFTVPGWRYADPRKGLLNDTEWQAARPVVCRSLGWSADIEPWPRACRRTRPCASSSAAARPTSSSRRWIGWRSAIPWRLASAHHCDKTCG